MNGLFRDPRTTVGGLIALIAVIGLLIHSLDLAGAVTILGIAGAWIGISGKDSRGGGPQG
jgi:hypothetical protein